LRGTHPLAPGRLLFHPAGAADAPPSPSHSADAVPANRDGQHGLGHRAAGRRTPHPVADQVSPDSPTPTQLAGADKLHYRSSRTSRSIGSPWPPSASPRLAPASWPRPASLTRPRPNPHGRRVKCSSATTRSGLTKKKSPRADAEVARSYQLARWYVGRRVGSRGDTNARELGECAACWTLMRWKGAWCKRDSMSACHRGRSLEARQPNTRPPPAPSGEQSLTRGHGNPRWTTLGSVTWPHCRIKAMEDPRHMDTNAAHPPGRSCFSATHTTHPSRRPTHFQDNQIVAPSGRDATSHMRDKISPQVWGTLTS